jgi:3-deoxy-D-manno-octulosonic acid kinase
MTDARIHADAAGLIVFDADLSPQVGHEWFDPEHWESTGRLHARGGGRGAACFIDTPAGPCVLRHFHRGGMVARLLGDRYLFKPFERTRGVAEFRLLARMRDMGLPVPQPLAARCVRHGLQYTADLITCRIMDAETLAEVQAAGRLDAPLAERVGALVGRFHARGVWHADLNAHNVLVTPHSLYLIDFDRGRLRTPATSWQQANLRRLRRSLVKLGAAGEGEQVLQHTIWEPLLRGHASSLAEASPT